MERPKRGDPGNGRIHRTPFFATYFKGRNGFLGEVRAKALIANIRKLA
ncbi:hypothetical protein KSC_035480 [Ktedonobacter sp. SOSP1-52]|nr:hypothetical protein KSC_035480 [Ktedonobacter sp. SOSP1-52]